MRPFLTLHHPADAIGYYRAGLWQNDTFYGLLLHNARNFADRLALIDSRRQLTWQQLKEWVDGIAAELRAFGLVNGDRVCGWMSNRVESIAVFLACSREGFVYNPSLHRSHTCAEVVSFMRLLDCRALIAEAGWGADRDSVGFDAMLAQVESLKVTFTPDELPAAAPNLTPYRSDPDRIVYIAFTSGTTGTPKCVMHSDNTLLANARELVRDWRHNGSTVILSLSPLSHHIAWVAVGQWLLTGCRLVTNDAPPARSSLDWIIQTGATYLMGVPTHAIDILAEARRRRSGLGSVKVFYLAGAPIPPAVCEEMLSMGITPQNVYGMTENSSHQYTLPSDSAEVIVNTCGVGGQAYEVNIFDTNDHNRVLPRNQVGQIGGRGAALMLGYFGLQNATAESFNETGWFMSGDLGMLDDAGNLSVVGRLKDTIIRGGHNIYPSSIEAMAMRHPEVNQAACIPVPDQRLGERVCLTVRGSIQWETLLDHLRDNGLSRYDMPEFLLRVDEFPLTASGKVLKRRLADMVARREVVPESVLALQPATRRTG